MTLTKEAAKNIIWKNPGITSYGLLAEFIKAGYDYQSSGENHFDKFIKNLTSDYQIRHTADDKFYVRKMIEIQIPIESERMRTNCYNCDFCRLLSDNPELSAVKNADHDVYCALNPRIQLKRQVHFPYHFECPLNMAIRRMLEHTQPDEDAGS